MPHTTPYALHAPADAGNPSSEMMRRDLIVSASSESPSIWLNAHTDPQRKWKLPRAVTSNLPR